MLKEIIINVHPYEKRIAILEDTRLVELFAEKKTQQILVGNIYKGIVRNVLPGMGAAFVDVGLNRTSFLHYRDLNFSLLDSANVKRGNDSSQINKVLYPGKEVLVQIKKDPIGKKGARLTGKISLPGKFLVFVPFGKRTAISRKITSSSEKNRIKQILKKIKDKKVSLIVRTEAEGKSKEDFQQEYDGLMKTWKLIEKQNQYSKAPYCLFDENDLSYTLIRDLFSSDIKRLVIDDNDLRNRIITKLNDVMPELIDRIELYKENTPIFDAFGIEKEIESIFSSSVKLPSGGNITIQQTEALVAIDVNTGSFTGKNNYHETIKKTNLEAAEEVARQIRLRDLSGIMVIDFIDMKKDKDREEVFSLLQQKMKNDRAKNKLIPFSPLGLVEISRKRTRPSLLLTFSEKCPYCNGSGRLLSKDSVAIRISRWLTRARYFIRKTPLRIKVHESIRPFLQKNTSFFDDFPNKIDIRYEKKIEADKFRIFSKITNKDITDEYKA